MKDRPFLRRGEVARLLKLCPATVSRLIDKGELEAFRVGGRIRISRRSVEKFTGVPLESPQEGQPSR
ncbi:MAG: helix-turn-helix domain-containing protein [Chloroflexi bacterium]|nr:helix-turn-helix domain-containing protein [Chloroflexota bacterium]